MVGVVILGPERIVKRVLSGFKYTFYVCLIVVCRYYLLCAPLTPVGKEPFHTCRCNGRCGIGISASQIGRILAADDIKPHRVDGWLTRRDTPEFWKRAADVCGLYLSPPANSVVLSIDERTGIQAKSPKYPTQPVRSRLPARREFEYVRHGTASLIAAMDVATGKVKATDIDRNDINHLHSIFRRD